MGKEISKQQRDRDQRERFFDRQQSLTIELTIYQEAGRFMRAGMTMDQATDAATKLWLAQIAQDRQLAKERGELFEQQQYDAEPGVMH